MDTITTIRDLLKCSGFVTNVTVALTPSELRLIAAAPEMAEALAPFARLLQKHHANMEDSRPAFGINDAEITVGDLRRARALLARIEGD